MDRTFVAFYRRLFCILILKLMTRKCKMTSMNWLKTRIGCFLACAKLPFFQKKIELKLLQKTFSAKLYKFVLNCFGQFQLKMYHLGYKITMTRLKGMQCNKIPVGGVAQICDILISFFVFFILNLGVNLFWVLKSSSDRK